MPRKPQQPSALLDDETFLERGLPTIPHYTNLTSRQKHFLHAFDRFGVITHAARTVGIARITVYAWMKPTMIQDGEGAGTEGPSRFRTAFELTKEMIIERAEATLMHLSIEGSKKPILYRGKIVGHTRVYDGDLLKFFLRHNKPEKYREKKELNVGNKDQKPFAIRSVEPATILNWKATVEEEMNRAREEKMP